MFTLMIKTHTVTDLRYMCVTSRGDYLNYTGSGNRWLNHLSKHGKTFTTEVIYQSDDIEDFSTYCLLKSSELDIVLSNEFANLIPEDGGKNSRENFKMFWAFASDALKFDIYKARASTLKETWGHIKTQDPNAWKRRSDKITVANIKTWEKTPKKERDAIIERIQAGVVLWRKNLTPEEKEIQRNVASACVKRMWANDSHRTRMSKAISAGRLNMTDKAKRDRALKIRESFSKSEKRKRFNEDMKVSRFGVNNPASKKVLWHGVTYSKLDFENRFGSIDSPEIKNTLDNETDCALLYEDNKYYESLLCPHCGKTSKGKQSAFKRWHFNNCGDKK